MPRKRRSKSGRNSQAKCPRYGGELQKKCSGSSGQQTMQPSPTPVEDQRTLALREAHKKLKRYYTKHSKGNEQFVNLALVERSPTVDKTKKDVEEFLDAAAHGVDRYICKEKNIEYETILTNTGSDSGKRVLINGPPGSGKTTLAHQLCRDLYSEHLPNQYQLVLFAELKAFRSYTNKKNKEAGLLTLLDYSGLHETDSLCSMIEKEEGSGVAIILDGYDEISDGSCKALAEWVSELFCDAPYLKVSECDVFITTRPSQLSQLTKGAPVRLEVLGFSSSDIECYINIYFKNAPGRAEEVIRRLTSLPLVRGLCSNPRVLEIACKVHKHLDAEPLPANLSGIFLRYICYQLEVDLTRRQPPVETKRVRDLLSVPKELFPGFYALCSLAFDCCLHQQLLLDEQELGRVKEYTNSRGSVYNLLFCEEVDSPSAILCVLYQCDHKTVMEALAAVHIAVLSPEEQQHIWKESFSTPHMAQVWMMYCGLTGLKSVDLKKLCYQTMSERSNEVMRDCLGGAATLEEKDMLVMVSLFEASNHELAKRVLPVLKNTIRGNVWSQHNILCLAYSITHHPHLSRVRLSLPSPIDCSKLDLQPLTTSLKNVKAIEFGYCGSNGSSELESLLTVLPRAVEDLSLDLSSLRTECRTHSYKVLGDALRDSHCLQSLTINTPDVDSALWTELDSVLHISRLTKFHLKSSRGAPSTETLKNLFVHREKCSLNMMLTDHQISALLSGLKRADKLKELDLDMDLLDSSEGNLDQWLVTCAEVEELVATHPHLVKVDIRSSNYCKSDLLIAVAKGAIRNKNITHLGLGRVETDAVHPLLCSPSADHITSIRAVYFSFRCDDDDAWSNLVAGPMARQTCHLILFESTPSSFEQLLLRVNTATKLKDLSINVHISVDEYDNAEPEGEFQVDKLAVEVAFSNSNLRKLRIEDVDATSEWEILFSAILNGLAANTTTQVDSCIHGESFNAMYLRSEQFRQRFHLIWEDDDRYTFMISRDPSCPSATEQDPSSDPQPQPMTTGQVSLSECSAGVKELLEKYRDRIYSDVVSTAVSPRLEMEEVISEEVAHEIKDKGDKKGNCLVYLHLLKQGDLQSLRTFSIVLKEETGNRKMQKLGEELLAELDQLQPAPS